MTDSETNLAHQNILIPMLLTTSEHPTQLDSISDLFIFLLRYSFMLNDATNTKNSCASKTTQLNAPQGNIYMGARYLDPKYSRWISVDPALGEYIPAAGKGNSENAGNLPGMGGIYNHINGDFYHYAGNNPVRYVDPDGRMFDDPFEKEFVYQVLGVEGLFAYNSSIILPIPNNLRSGSFIGGFVFYECDIFFNPMSNGKNTFIHELFHQIQYNQNPACQIDLINEYFLNEQMANKGSVIGYETHYTQGNGSMYTIPLYDGKTIANYTYQYEKFNLTKYNTLNDLPFYESQAQFVGDYADLYYDVRYGGESNDYYKYRLKQMARIMKNSGYEETEAVKWIESNIE